MTDLDMAQARGKFLGHLERGAMPVDLDAYEREANRDDHNTGVTLLPTEMTRALIAELRALRAVRDAAQVFEGAVDVYTKSGKIVEIRNVHYTQLKLFEALARAKEVGWNSTEWKMVKKSWRPITVLMLQPERWIKSPSKNRKKSAKEVK